LLPLFRKKKSPIAALTTIGRRRSTQIVSNVSEFSRDVKLDARHLEDLAASGLSEETIQRAGLYSASPQEGSTILGFRLTCRGLAFPYPNLNENGRPPFVRVKPDVPPIIGGKPAKYLSPKGSTNRLYVPPGVEAAFKDTAIPFYVTEGEKKALKAAQEGLKCVALAGVWCWKARTEAGQSPLIADLDVIAWSGREVHIVYDSDAASNRKVYEAEAALAHELTTKGAQVDVIRLPGANGKKVGLDDYLLKHSIDDLRGLSHEIVGSIRACHVSIDPGVEQATTWLWRDRIPLGELTTLDGDPGLGKSLITLDLAARVSRGAAMPREGCAEISGPRGVVILAAEDNIESVIRPRLRRAGADGTRITVMTEVSNGVGERRPPHLQDLEALRMLITRLDAALVIIDPLMAFLPVASDSHKDQDIRRVLAPLARLAAETGAAILVVRHLNKSANGNPLYRGAGSTGIIAAARSGLLVAVDPADASRRVLASIKSNLAAPAASLSYRVIEINSGVAGIEWCGQSDLTAAALLAAVSDPEESSTERAEAAAWLKAMLADGPVSAKTLRREAEDAGHAWRTIRRAQSAMRIIVAKSGYQGTWEWRLSPGDGHSRGVTPAQDGHPQEVATFGPLTPPPAHKSLKNTKDGHLSKDGHPVKSKGSGHLWDDPSKVIVLNQDQFKLEREVDL
jgi:hypothetical protein